MIELRVSVVTVINRWAIEELGGKLATWEGTQRVDTKKPLLGLKKKDDRFAALNPEGPASVTVGLEEKLSGPSGTYSSVAVHISVTARCDQNEAAIVQARDVLFKEGLQALEHYMRPALNLLLEHTK
jgi:hypothetical protein